MSDKTEIKGMGAIPHAGGSRLPRVGASCAEGIRHRIVQRMGGDQASHAGRGERLLVC